VFDSLNVSDLPKFQIPIPPLTTQSRIADILDALDGKIEVNSLVSQKADQLWRLHFESTVGLWDANGDGLPSGWRKTPLSSLARFVNGRNFTRHATGAGRIVVRIAELKGGPGRSTVYNEINVPDEHVAHPGDLLFAWSGSLTVRRWFRPEGIVNQHIFKVIPASEFNTWFVHGHLLRLLPWYRQVAADKATTMGHIQRHHLDELVLVPDKQTLARLDAVCRPLWERALAAERESLVLAELRDTVLPKLVTGELWVGGAEGQASAS
jgi:type I restriction enzyme S subunit